MKNKILILLLLLLSINGFSQIPLTALRDTKIPKLVTKKEAVAIGKIVVDFEYDVDYMRKCLNLSKIYKPVNAFVTSPMDAYGYDGAFKNNDYFHGTFKKNSKETCFFSTGKFYLFEEAWAYIDIPLNFEFTIPEEAKYVYIGTIYVKLDPVTSKVTEIKRLDEYDQAKEWLQKQKADAELVRVELVPQKEARTKTVHTYFH